VKGSLARRADGRKTAEEESMKSETNSAIASVARNRDVFRWFCVSCLMLLFPVSEVWWGFSKPLGEPQPVWVPSVVPYLLLLWFASSVLGLLSAIRSLHLAIYKPNVFGGLSYFLVLVHIVSLLLLGFLIVLGHSAG